MDKQSILNAITQLKKHPKRKFDQTFELIINLRDLDLKKPNNHVDAFIQLPNERGKAVKLCALVGPELKDAATKHCDHVILVDEFVKFAGDKKAIKKIADQYDYFIAQATIMPKVAQTFGRYFGPRQKMPNPKAGCVVPPNANMEVVSQKLRKTVRVMAKTQASIKLSVGSEKLDDAKLVENVLAIYNATIRSLPHEKNNIKNVMLKLTMSPVIKIGDKKQEVEA